MRTSLPARSTRPRSARFPGVALAIVVLLSFLAPLAAHAQGFRIFRDGNGYNFWDPSYGVGSLGSSLEVVNGSKLPVDYVTKWRGSSSIRLRWTSVNGGDWVAGVSSLGWTPFDANPLDSLVFFAYSTTAIPAADLPRMLVEDSYNRRSIGQSMAAYNPAGLPAGVWTRLVMPLGPIKAAPGTADMSLVNKAFFQQTPTGATNVQRTMWIDELRFVAADATPPAGPVNPLGIPYERHVDAAWTIPAPADVESYRVDRQVNGTWTPVTWGEPKDGGTMVWLGAPGVACTLRVVAEDWSFRESAPSPTFELRTRVLSDADFMDMIQRSTFRYFWEFAHPVSGLIRERTSSGDVCASGGTGFGLMCIPVGVERGYVTRPQAVARVLQVLNFLGTTTERHWGAYPHWIHGVTGQHVGFLGPTDDTVDLVETSFMAQAFLTLRQYFDGPGADEAQIRTLCTQLWEAIEWDAFKPAGSNTLRWHRSPTTGLSSATITGWNEAMIVYLLGVASPTHPLPAVTYSAGWARNGGIVQTGTYYGKRLYVGPGYGGPMFFAHYSFLGFDPRAKHDAYANYFTHNRNQALVQVAYATANPLGHVDYAADSWGLTASDQPNGYAAHAPYSNDNGTLTPTAALASMPYVPQQSLAAGRHFYETWGTLLWTFRGFKDAYNIDNGWFASDEIAIDQGPIVIMIENLRSGLLWNRFMRNPEIAPMLATLGFVADSTAVTGAPESGAPRPLRLAASPNPTTGPVLLEFEMPQAGDVTLEVFDLAGRRMSDLRPGRMSAGRHALDWNGRGEDGRAAPAGVYLARVTVDGHSATSRVVRVK